jgi:hypothetical protein
MGRRGSGHDKSSFSTDSPGSAEWNPFLNDAYRMGMRSSRFSSGGLGGHPANLESLFQMSSKLSQDLDKGLGAGNSGALGSALGVLPKLNQLERNGLKLPVDSPFGKFQFSYRDQLGQGPNAMGAGIGRGSAQASFNSTGLKDDMLHFSATAMFGGPGSGMGMGSGMGSSSFESGVGTGAGNGMFSTGNMNGAGIGSGGSGGFAAGSMHGAMGSMGSMGDATGGMRGMGGQGGHGHAEPGPSVSLKLTFK